MAEKRFIINAVNPTIHKSLLFQKHVMGVSNLWDTIKPYIKQDKMREDFDKWNSFNNSNLKFDDFFNHKESDGRTTQVKNSTENIALS